jgi:arylsulfatase A-like enzyme
MRALALSAAAAWAACRAAHSSALPNVVVYLADDLGVGEVNQHDLQWAVTDTPAAPAAGRAMHTPNLARLARGGLRLLRSYTSSPICGPARYSLMTGLPTGLTGVRGNNDEALLGTQLATLPRLLKQNGYRTYMVRVSFASPLSRTFEFA